MQQPMDKPANLPDRLSGALPALVVTCEHGGNHIPSEFEDWFRGAQALLVSHQGFDPGALLMAEDLAVAFGAPLVQSTVSRLLVDLNRSQWHARLHGKALLRASVGLRREILARYYQPYRDEVEARVREAIATQGRVVHLSSHSFTPELDGRLRRADVGLLYDPARSGEAALCAHWKTALQNASPGITVRRNYPYAGKGDGLTKWFRQQFLPQPYIGIELEINQRHVFGDPYAWTALRQAIIESLVSALAVCGMQA